MQREPDILRKDHDPLAVLILSGEQIEVGTISSQAETALYFKTSENVEPVYMGAIEAELLIAALTLGVAQSRGEQ